MGYEYNPEWKRGEGVALLEAPLSGRVAMSSSAEFAGITYYDPASGTYILKTPPTIPIGSECGAQWVVINLSGEDIYINVYVYPYDASGHPIGVSAFGPTRLAPGQSFANHMKVLTTMPGLYTFTFELYTGRWPDLTLVDKIERQGVAFVVGQNIPLGWISAVWYWSNGGWSLDSPEDIPLGEDLGIRGVGQNTSMMSEDMRIDCITRSPGGRTRTITGEVKAGVSPREYPIWNFKWASDEIGVWTANLILYARFTGEVFVEVDRKMSRTVGIVTEAAPPPSEFKGTISKKQLKYDTTERDIPAGYVLPGQRGIITVWCRNDMATRQQLGCMWTIKDPDGQIIEVYPGGGIPDWEWGYTGPGDAQDFIGGRFDLSKTGTYTIAICFFMNPDNPVLVDPYEGAICVVGEEVPPPEDEYKLIQHTEYPRGKTYDGRAEQCTFEFKLLPEQIPGVAWLGKKVAENFANEVAKHDAEMLDLKVYEDATPTFWTNYRVIATATASPVPWAIIIPVVLAILFIVAITFLIKEIKTVDWTKPVAALPVLGVLLGIGALAGLGFAVAAKKGR